MDTETVFAVLYIEGIETVNRVSAVVEIVSSGSFRVIDHYAPIRNIQTKTVEIIHGLIQILHHFRFLFRIFFRGIFPVLYMVLLAMQSFAHEAIGTIHAIIQKQ